MRLAMETPAGHSGISGSTELRPSRPVAKSTYAAALASSKVAINKPKQVSSAEPAKSTSTAATTSSSSTATEVAGDLREIAAAPRTKAAARRARRKVLEARYAPNLPPPSIVPSALPEATKSTSEPCFDLAASTTASSTLSGPATGAVLVGKKKKTRRSGVKARRRIENAQNREVEAVEAALDELDLNGSDSDEEAVRDRFRTSKISPVKSKSQASTIIASPVRSKPVALSPPRTALRPLRTPFAAHSTALAASTPSQTPAPMRSAPAQSLAPASSYGAFLGTPSAPRSFLLGSRMLGVTGSLDPFASRVGLTPRLPSPSPAVTAVLRASSPIPASPASSAGLKLAWEEGSSYMSGDFSFDAASSPSQSTLGLPSEELDNTRDEIIDVEDGNDTTLDEDEVDELSILKEE